MALSLNKGTGKFSKSSSDYEQIFEDLMRYGKANPDKVRKFEDVESQDDLFRWLKSVTGGKNVSKLSSAIAKTNTYKQLEKENILSDVGRPKTIQVKKKLVTAEKDFAKKNKIIFSGVDKIGRRYFYDYKKKKRVKNPL